MTHRIPSEPGADYLDDAIERLRAMKSAVGLVLARALEAAHSRFLVFGSTLATLASKVGDLEERDNISWPALDERLSAIEKELAGFNMARLANAEWRATITARLEELEGRSDTRASITLLRAALDVLDPPLTIKRPGT